MAWSDAARAAAAEARRLHMRAGGSIMSGTTIRQAASSTVKRNLGRLKRGYPT